MKFTGPLLNQRWQLGPRMGAGSQAHSFVARDVRAPLERLVVVKQLRLGKGSGGWKPFDLFEREIRVLKGLEHPGIPRFLDSFESEPGVFNLVMEKAPGATLRAIATRVTFTDRELCDVMERVLTVLVYLHSVSPPVIHRDIKPANLVRAADGSICLVDFGGVREAANDKGGSTVIGTFGYMAPEQLHGEATAATDIYSLGATIVAIAGGLEPEHVPRDGLRMNLTHHLKSRAPALVEMLAAMTEPSPSDRPQSAAATLRRLKKVRKQLGSKRIPGQQPVDEPAGNRSHDAQSDPSVHTLAPKPDTIPDKFLADFPRPIRKLLGVLFFVVGIGGYAGLTILRVALLPLIFGSIAAFCDEKSRRDIASAREKVGHALDEGRDGFLILSGRSPKNALPQARGDDH